MSRAEHRRQMKRGGPRSFIDSLTEQQRAHRIIVALGAEGESFTDEELERASDWVDLTLASYGMLELVMAGLVVMRWNEEKQEFEFTRHDHRDIIAHMDTVMGKEY